MSRSTVLAGLQTYLLSGRDQGKIPYLAQVFITPPKMTQEGMFFYSSGIGTGVIIDLWTSSQLKRRFAMEGGQPDVGEHGIQREYTVDACCALRTVTPGDPLSGDSLIGQQNNDFLDGLESWIESDPTLGGTVFSAGEGTGFGRPDMRVQTGLPFFTGDSAMAQMDSVMQITILEIVL